MIYLFLAQGCEEIEALCPLDLLRRAGLAVTTVGIGGTRITGSHGITMEADIADVAFDDKAPEAIILPGGMPGTQHLDASPVVETAIRHALASHAWLCAICAAPSILGKRGLLAGRRAACFPGFEKELLGAVSVGGKVIRDGRFITAAGMGVAMEFGLEIISVLKSPETAGAIRAAIQAP